MMKIKFLSLVISLLLTSQVWAAAWDQSMPLESPEQQAEAFLKIRALIPSMSEGATRYAFDPAQVLQNQFQIESMMAESPVYLQLKNAHKDLVSFTVFSGVKENGDASAKTENWNNWIVSSTTAAHQLGVNTPASAVRKIQELLNSPLLGKSQGIVVGLAQLLPKEIKKDFFAMSLATKVDVLAKNLPAEVVSQGFAPSRLGWSDNELSRIEIINRLEASVHAEQVFIALMVYHYSELQGEFTSPKDYLSKWKLEGSAKKTIETMFNSQVVKLIPTEQKSTQVSLVMREVSPIVGVFRGFAGNDCSTSLSFPFVNSPNEYTFLVYDTKGGVKGYVQGTKVLVHGRASFYLHTIVGPRISKDDTFNITSTLNQEKSHMGWDEILLPPVDKMTTLVNSMIVRDAMKEMTLPTLVPMEYQDTDIRDALKTTFKISKDYDDAATNTFGHKLNVAKIGAVIQVERGPVSGLEKVDARIDKNELIGMLLQLGKKNKEKNGPMIEALVAHANLSESGVAVLTRKANNYSKYPAQFFISDFAENLKKEGFTFKEDYFKKNLSLLAWGLLQSPDLVKDQKLLEATLATLYAQNETAAVEKFLISYKYLFAQKNISDAFFKAHYIDFHEAESEESNALRAALQVSPRNILSNPEVLAMIMASSRGSSVLRDFLLEKASFEKDLESSEAGRLLLARVRIYRHKKNFILAELLKANSEGAYVNILEDRVKELFGFPTLKENSRLRRQLMAASLDHYLSLKPSETLHVPRELFLEAGYERELRRIIPALMLTPEIFKVKWHLKQLAEKSRSSSDGLARAISYGLSQRPDIATITTRDLPDLKNSFPEIDLNSLVGFRCENLF